jgi:hypothetical protein
LYTIACDVDFDESEPFFDHWWELPADERLKQAVLNNVRAF